MAVDTEPAAMAVELVKRERDLLDAADLVNWMSLFCEDGVYWMPSHPGQTDPHAEISLLFEDRSLMEIRAKNFGHRLSPSMAHRLRACRLVEVTSVEALQELQTDWKITAKFHAAISYREEQTLFAGQYEYLIRFVAGRPLIRQKRVDLINAEAPLKNIMIYI